MPERKAIGNCHCLQLQKLISNAPESITALPQISLSSSCLILVVLQEVTDDFSKSLLLLYQRVQPLSHFWLVSPPFHHHLHLIEHFFPQQPKYCNTFVYFYRALGFLSHFLRFYSFL